MLFQGVVSNPMTQKNQSGGNPTAIMGPSGDVLVSELHGKYYNANINGGLYYASSASAGSAFTIFSNATGVGLFLLNPAGSGKNLVLTKAKVGMNSNAATAASAWGYAWQNNVGAGGVGTAAPLTLFTQITATRGSCICGPAGQGASVALAGSAATFTTALTWGRAASFGTGTGAITVAWGVVLEETFDGSMIVPPNCIFSLTSAILSGITAVGTLEWMEVPVVGS